MATSDASQQLTLTCKSEFPEYVSTEEGTCWALLSTQAPPYVDESKTRAPLQLVVVVDKSGSMEGEKLKMVRETLKFVVNQSKCELSFGFFFLQNSIVACRPRPRSGTMPYDRDRRRMIVPSNTPFAGVVLSYTSAFRHFV